MLMLDEPSGFPEIDPMSEAETLIEVEAPKGFVLDLLKHPEVAFDGAKDVPIPRSWRNALAYALIARFENDTNDEFAEISANWKNEFSAYCARLESQSTQITDLTTIADILKFAFFAQYMPEEIKPVVDKLKLKPYFERPEFYECLYFSQVLALNSELAEDCLKKYFPAGKDYVSKRNDWSSQARLVNVLGFLRLTDFETFEKLKGKIDWEAFMIELSGQNPYDKYASLASAKLVLADLTIVSSMDGIIVFNMPENPEGVDRRYKVPVVSV